MSKIPDSLCPRCGSEDLGWGIAALNDTSVPDGRLSMRDVSLAFLLSCDECEAIVEEVAADSEQGGQMLRWLGTEF